MPEEGKKGGGNVLMYAILGLLVVLIGAVAALIVILLSTDISGELPDPTPEQGGVRLDLTDTTTVNLGEVRRYLARGEDGRQRAISIDISVIIDIRDRRSDAFVSLVRNNVDLLLNETNAILGSFTAEELGFGSAEGMALLSEELKRAYNTARQAQASTIHNVLFISFNIQ
jgi:flagellar basal body-associated protein FliL